MANPTKMRAENVASDAEWQTRRELAALYRIMDIYGMTDLSNQAVGARVKDEPDHYLIHPYGIFFEEIRASDFIKIDADGKPVDGVIPTVATAAVNPINDGVKNLSTWIFVRYAAAGELLYSCPLRRRNGGQRYRERVIATVTGGCLSHAPHYLYRLRIFRR